MKISINFLKKKKEEERKKRKKKNKRCEAQQRFNKLRKKEFFKS